MHEAHYADGRVERQVITGMNDGDLKRKLASARAASEADGAVEIRQRKIGRNEKCPCGSGYKFKKCCMRRHMREAMQGGQIVGMPKHGMTIDELAT